MSAPLPKEFRKLPIEERRAALQRGLGLEGGELAAYAGLDMELADVLVESAVGYLPVPLGIASGFLIDGAFYDLPMATEEPSVIAAATFAARLIGAEGGFSTWATEPEMSAQLFLEGVSPQGEAALRAAEPEIAAALGSLLAGMAERGGGYRGLEVARLPESRLLRVELSIDVRDAMGANLLNSAAEEIRPLVERSSGGTTLMAILSNEAARRRAGATFRLSLKRLARGGFSGEEAGRRIALAAQVAREDPSRAVTHNKGIMNGITALAVATGNDTRGIEAAAHRWACRDGRYRGLSSFEVLGEELLGRLELPLAFASVGGSVGVHPATALSLRLLGGPNGPQLARIAAALGLAQNFAALFALVTEGIQKGHMRHHAARLAVKAGARGEEIRELAGRIAKGKRFTVEAAILLLEQLRRERM